MTVHTIFLYLSTIIGLITPIIGIIAIFKGTYRPQRTTRLIFLFITSLFVATLFAQGDRNGIILALIQLMSSTLIFILSLKYGMGGKGKLDITVLLLALFAIVVWKITDSPFLALTMSVIADLIGFSPTLIKAYMLPHTEDWRFYASDVFAGLFSLLSISLITIQNLAFPLYIFLINLSVALIIIFRQRRSHK